MARKHYSPAHILLAGIAAAGFMFVTEAVQAAAAGDAGNGEDVFMQNCAVCHSFENGAPNKIGPNLFGVVGRAAGSADGYMYSDAMANSGLTWNIASLQDYLAAPQMKVPGTKMGFPGFADPQDEADTIAYLATLK